MTDPTRPSCTGAGCHACDAPQPVLSTVPAAPDAAFFRISTMDCPVEEAEIRRALEPVAGIRSLGFQLGARTLAITAPAEVLARALEAIGKAGFVPQPLLPAPAGAAGDGTSRPGAGLHGPMVRPTAALLLALVAEATGWLPAGASWTTALGMGLSAAAIWLAGLDTCRKGLAALLRGKLNINALMAVAVTGAFLIGQWPEAAMVMALYAIAELIEARSVDRARNAIQGLMALTPQEALVQQPDGGWLAQKAETVPLQAVVRIRPGERVPLDGVVVRGSSAINQAPVTGESTPVDKTVGDPVFAGTINDTGELAFRVTAAASDTTLARIVQAVEQAQGSRAQTQRFVDRFAAIYTPAVFALAVTVAVLSPWLMGWTWLASAYKALVLLVIACPCALVISTPVTVVSALAAAARRGILIKGGVHLENARKLRVLAFDKTGTITEGKPKLVSHHGLSGDAQQAFRLAASLASRSDHPVSRALVDGLQQPLEDVADFTALAGHGVRGTIGGRSYQLGSPRMMSDLGPADAALQADIRRHEEAGRTVTLLASETERLGLFAVADTLKPSAAPAMAELRALGLTTVMLSGDNAASVQAMATLAGLSEAQGQLLPEDKLRAIEDWQRRSGATAMVGDGINDAPALARADLGLAMGAAGTDIAMEAADVVIMNDDLRRVPALIRLSRRTHAVLWQNIAFALGIKLAFVVLAVFGHATMWMAVFADMGASLLVVGNGLRLLRSRFDATPG